MAGTALSSRCCAERVSSHGALSFLLRTLPATHPISRSALLGGVRPSGSPATAHTFLSRTRNATSQYLTVNTSYSTCMTNTFLWGKISLIFVYFSTLCAACLHRRANKFQFPSRSFAIARSSCTHLKNHLRENCDHRRQVSARDG